MRILITGAGGQLGRQLQAAPPPGAELFTPASGELDISDRAAVRSALTRIEPHLIINTAAYTQVDMAEAEPGKAFGINAQGIANLAEAAGAGTRLIHISTDFVFDGLKTTPYLPADPASPLNVYGHSKLEGENRLRQRRPDAVILRTAWLYSAHGGNFVKTMLRLMNERDRLSVVDDQKGTPTSAASLAEAIWRFAALLDPTHAFAAARDDLARPGPSGIYHWTDQGEASWYEFAVAIQQQALELGLLTRRIPITPIRTQEYPTPARRPANSVLDKSATYEAIGWRGRPWREELALVLKSIQESAP